MQVALTIAGSDSGGGAGIQADLKTFEAYEVFGASVVTAVTAQNTQGVQGAWPVPPEVVQAQLHSVLSDLNVKAVKTGMLYDAATIRLVAEVLKDRSLNLPLVVDPVMVATSGDRLLKEDALQALKSELLPLAKVITPNIPEAEALTGIQIGNREDMAFAAEILAEFYPEAWILIKGGHLAAESKIDDQVSDLLYHREAYWLDARRIKTRHTHGTGCTLSAAITAYLCRRKAVFAAVKDAKSYVHGAISQAWKGYGKGRGSLRHNHRKSGNSSN